MKTLIAGIAILGLSACGSMMAPSQQDLVKRNIQGADPADVRYCDFEATKANVGGDSNTLANAYFQNERRAGIFNNCMVYRTGLK